MSMGNGTLQPTAPESNHRTGGGVNDLRGTAGPETSSRSDAILSPKEIAATKVYSSIDEILIDSKRYESELESLRSRPMWLDLVIGTAGAGIGFFGIWFYAHFNTKFASLPVELIAPLTLGIIVFAARMGSRQARMASLQAALEILEVRKRGRTIMSASPGLPTGTQGQGSPSGEYFGRLVDINVKNLGDYYGLVRLHNDKSFRVSVAAGVIGFVLIAVAIALSLLLTGSPTLPTSISAASGVITEFISAVFFLLYNRSVREMGAYFKSLLEVQKILLSLKLVNDTRNEKDKVKMVEMMISYLVGREILVGKAFADSIPEDQPETRPPKGKE